MRAADRIRNYLLEKRTGLTVSPANFIPVILAGEEEGGSEGNHVREYSDAIHAYRGREKADCR